MSRTQAPKHARGHRTGCLHTAYRYLHVRYLFLYCSTYLLFITPTWKESSVVGERIEQPTEGTENTRAGRVSAGVNQCGSHPASIC